MSEVTRILCAIEQGDPHAAEQLLPLVYDELRRLAARKMIREKSGQTLQANRPGSRSVPTAGWQGRGAPLGQPRAFFRRGSRCAASWSRTPGASAARNREAD
jgi:hypothetical protein